MADLLERGKDAARASAEHEREEAAAELRRKWYTVYEVPAMSGGAPVSPTATPEEAAGGVPTRKTRRTRKGSR